MATTTHSKTQTKTTTATAKRKKSGKAAQRTGATSKTKGTADTNWRKTVDWVAAGKKAAATRALNAAARQPVVESNPTT